MSIRAVEDAVQRAIVDPQYRTLLATEPDRALHGYELTVAEREALIAGDTMKLQELGVSPEASLLAAELNREGSHIA